MTKTTNYKLNKPEQTDFYDIDIQNENMDTIDSSLTKKVDKVAGKQLSTNDYTNVDKSKVNNVPDNTKSELDNKASKTDLSNHANNATVHISTTDRNYWNQKMPSVTSPTAGNVPLLKSDGTLADSGKKLGDYLSSTHESKTINNASGLHGIRYWNKKLEVNTDGDWKVAGGVGIVANIHAPDGSTVTITDGSTVITTIGSSKVDLPNYGVWQFVAVLDDKPTNTVTLNCDASRVYDVYLTYFTATVRVEAHPEGTIYLSDGQSDTSPAVFTVNYPGTYTAYAMNNGVKSDSATINVEMAGNEYYAMVNFAVLEVDAPAGSTVIIVNNEGIVDYKWSNYVFYLPKLGEYTIHAELDDKVREMTVNVVYYQTYNVELSYYHVWGVDIDTEDPNPRTCLTYTDEATDSTDWDSVIGNKPCILVDGKVIGYLDPNDYSKYADGTTAPITTIGNDVMVEFPKRGYSVVTDGTVIHIKITDELNNSNFSYKPWSRESEGDREYFYIGAYASYKDKNLMYSASGYRPTSTLDLPTARAYTTNRGKGYSIQGWVQFVYIQCCYILKFKNLDSQTAVGVGHVAESSTNTITNTGTTNSLGMNLELASNYWKTSGLYQVKCLGIESLWGNLLTYVDGILTNNLTVYTCYIPSKFSSDYTSDGYVNWGKIPSSGGSYMSAVIGNTDCGFIPTSLLGSGTTYFCDYSIITNTTNTLCGITGGSSGTSSSIESYNNKNGIFHIRLGILATALSEITIYGSRLMYV